MLPHSHMPMCQFKYSLSDSCVLPSINSFPVLADAKPSPDPEFGAAAPGPAEVDRWWLSPETFDRYLHVFSNGYAQYLYGFQYVY